MFTQDQALFSRNPNFKLCGSMLLCGAMCLNIILRDTIFNCIIYLFVFRLLPLVATETIRKPAQTSWD
jgi:hypothetical protein